VAQVVHGARQGGVGLKSDSCVGLHDFLFAVAAWADAGRMPVVETIIT